MITPRIEARIMRRKLRQRRRIDGLFWGAAAERDSRMTGATVDVGSWPVDC
jgi:hypothetical protein